MPKSDGGNIWSKLLGSLRGGAHELGEDWLDSRALRILDQEIRDCDIELRQSRESLAHLLARHTLAERALSESGEKIAEYETYAIKALASGEETLAREVADKIVQLESSRSDDQRHVQALAASVAELRKTVAMAEGNIRRLKQQLDTVKATESVQRAQAAVAQRYAGPHNKMPTAIDSLARIKQKQAERGARVEAAEQLARTDRGDALERKLRDAGIMADDAGTDAVLTRLRQKLPD
ncbi:PspA/IM30 family protein [Lysobacter capsici]|jgi:phage shock protein A|uniref:PspA/IM30 family protein n=1 Tax=Lysobacter capsici TaxID=435897 RepID=UPI000BBA4D51|nr:PspA/IM30 family protein [Lysobacter capsici]ATE70162.1 phage shock protein A [Lysobacter capsici]UOF15376.1 PspA/IM30 family protein [Lysobacter capsici]